MKIKEQLEETLRILPVGPPCQEEATEHHLLL